MNKHVWEISFERSIIDFKVKYLAISTIRGYVYKFKGTVLADESFQHIDAHLFLESKSIDTLSGSHNQKLRSVDYLDAESHPYIEFHSLDGCRLSSGRVWELTGNLSLRTIIRPVTFIVNFSRIDRNPGKDEAYFNLFAAISLKEFGIHKTSLSDKVQLCAQISLFRNPSLPARYPYP